MPKPFLGRVWTGLLLAGGLAAGCVHRQISPGPEAVETTLTVVRSGEDVQLNWMSRAGVIYTVVYSDGRRPGVPWSVLPQADQLMGTGQALTVRDQAPPGVHRYYRLQLGARPPAPPRPPPKRP